MPAGQIIQGSLTSAARGTAFDPLPLRPFNIVISGTFVATLVIVRTLDGVTWVPLAKPDLSGVATFISPITFSAFDGDGAMQWAVSAATADGGSYTSGTINYTFDT